MTYSYLAIETTGLDSNTEEVIKVNVDETVYLFKPTKALSSLITKLTGLTDEVLAEEPSQKEAKTILQEALNGKTVVVNNEKFTKGFLEKYGVKVTYLDIQDVYRINPTVLNAKSNRLPDLYAAVGGGKVETTEDKITAIKAIHEYLLAHKPQEGFGEIVSTQRMLAYDTVLDPTSGFTFTAGTKLEVTTYETFDLPNTYKYKVVSEYNGATIYTNVTNAFEIK